MNISKIEIGTFCLPYKQPIKVAIGTIIGANNVLVKITTESGLFGWGEASPSPYITGDTVESNYVVARDIAEIIKGKNALAIETRTSEIKKKKGSGTFKKDSTS